MLKPGQPIPKDMDPVVADNIKFYRAHKDELQPAIMKFKTLSRQINKSGKSESGQ